MKWWLVGAVVVVVLAVLSTLRLGQDSPKINLRISFPVEEGAHVINGIVRGASEDNPILLVLHGGPGLSEIPWISDMRGLEDSFIVVNYDQRGAGMSCDLTKEYGAGWNSTVDMHVHDVIEITEQLLEQFGKQKLYLWGGSWGTVLALKAAQLRAELYHAIALRGWFVDGTRNELHSTKYVLETLEKTPDADPEVIKKIRNLKLPFQSVDDLLFQRKWLYATGGNAYACRDGCKSYGQFISVVSSMILCTEYTIQQKFQFEKCFKRSLSKTWPELDNYVANVKSEVPVYVLQGVFDFNTPSDLVEEFYAKLDAPKKEIIWFEKSSHSPHREENDKFVHELKRVFGQVTD
jgi:pimeloyl-ACP methyl ester carboxylesterase